MDLNLKNKIQIILPLYNEAKNIQSLIDKIKQFKKNSEANLFLILINDGSIDQTHVIIQKVFEADWMIYDQFEKNRGYSMALKKGIKLASNEGSIVFFDGDNQFDIFELNKFLELQNKYDIIVGKRVKRQDSCFRDMLGKTWSRIGKVFYRTRIDDLNCGFKLFNSKIIKQISVVAKGPGINLDIFSHPMVKTCSIKQIEVTHYPRLEGKATGLSLKTVMVSLSDLFYILTRRLFSNQ